MIRALLVDDETPARKKLKTLLASESGIEIAGEAADGREALRQIRELDPDLVFLDIQMPRLDGFGVVEALDPDHRPLIVFVTAFDEYAVRAFEVNALDYLLKPFAASRLHQVLDRARQHLQEVPESDLARRMEAMLDLVRARRYSSRLLVRTEDEREHLLGVDRVNLIRAERNYLRFHSAEGEYLRRMTMNEITEKLDPEKFLRINRSEIVRLDAVREIEPWFHGDSRVVMKDGTTLTWSRRYRARTRDRF